MGRARLETLNGQQVRECTEGGSRARKEVDRPVQKLAIFSRTVLNLTGVVTSRKGNGEPERDESFFSVTPFLYL